jgi:hypothetical protein
MLYATNHTVIVGRIVPAFAGLIRQNKELRMKSGEPAWGGTTRPTEA